ncbi:hypothetical protein [Lihuaxuella thermophila]|uniref:Uncharacterized protein n=1 Tax=Lihuaxuella thermophila TaxID=1173111 RepID=A0A1H8AGG4_9BACL|nr:hypothetical protein [Lihuaxuella thermophila]SEM69586.1 hypothetical protein SAMN05444955_101127 [Lihuaxuella thermophila]
MAFSLKKILGTAVAIGLVGGILLGAGQVGYADIQSTLKDKRLEKLSSFFHKKKADEHQSIRVTEKVASYLGMKKEDVEAVLREKSLGIHQIALAAVIAKKSNQPLSQVASAIKQKRNWKEVVQAYRMDPKEVWKELRLLFPQLNTKMHFLKNHPALLFQALASYLGREPEEIRKALYHSRVHPEGAMHAAVLAKASGKRLEEVLAIKTEKKTWKEVASALRVSPDQVKVERKKLQQLFRQELKKWREQLKEDK